MHLRQEEFRIFDNCTCKFELTIKKVDLEEKLITVTYNGSVKHAAGEREAELPSAAKASGNRTGCGVQPTTMRKICSEGRQLSQMDENLVKSLEKVKIDKRGR